jgi:hypothetical protein
MQGNYSVLLQAGDSPGPVSVSISQTGLIPGGTRSIQMMINPFSGDYLGVSVGGQNIPMVVLSRPAYNNWLVAGDVSSFAGMTEQLTISALTSPSFHFGQLEVDNISFSTTPLPEPTTWALLLAGAAALGLVSRRRRG